MVSANYSTSNKRWKVHVERTGRLDSKVGCQITAIIVDHKLFQNYQWLSESHRISPIIFLVTSDDYFTVEWSSKKRGFWRSSADLSPSFQRRRWDNKKNWHWFIEYQRISGWFLFFCSALCWLFDVKKNERMKKMRHLRPGRRLALPWQLTSSAPKSY